MILVVLFLTLLTTCAACFLYVSRPDRRAERMAARFGQVSRNSVPVEVVPDVELLKQEERTSFRLLAPLVRALKLQQRLGILSQQAGMSITAQRFLLLCCGSASAGGLLAYLVLRSWIISSLAASLAALIPLLVLHWKRKKRLRIFGEKLPEVVDAMARAIRAGHTLVAAIGIVAEGVSEPCRGEFTEVFRQQHFGLPLRDAMLALLVRVPSQDLRVLVTAILVQRETGGNLTQILDRTSVTIRERLKLQGDIRVHTAQGRFTGWILCLLPVVLLVVINVMNPGYSQALTTTAVGHKLLYGGAALLAIGAYTIRRIVNGISI